MDDRSSDGLPDAVAAAIDDRRETYREALFDLLRQPSVSATGEGMDACADLVVELAEEYGFDEARRIETDRYPLVYAERIVGDDAPTVVCYGHYDVQPPGEADDWGSPPFEPTVRDGAIYARGAGDNKGQFAAHAFGLDALLAADAAPDANVKLLIEGGEESGSAGLREYLADDPGEVADADLVYVADGPTHPHGRPWLIYGNRGILSLQLDHRTADRDLHSGNYGGPAPNAANELVEVVASTFDAESDEITVEGFHEGVAITDADRELVAEIPGDGEAILADVGADRLATEKGYYERLLLEPTLTINGIHAGYGGEGTKTIVPAQATAKIDCRLVPDQDPDAVFEAIREHVRERRPEIEVTKQVTFPPMKTPLDAPAADDVAAAIEDAWGRPPVEVPVLGGSMPAAYVREALDVPVLLVPYANPDQNNHAPDEHLDLDYFENGIRTSAAVFSRFGG